MSNAVHRVLAVLLALPVVAWAVAVAIAYGRAGRGALDAGDFAVAVAVAAYAALVVWALRTPRRTARAALVSASTLAGWLGFEALYARLGPVQGTPWPPGIAVRLQVDPRLPGLERDVMVSTSRLGLRGRRVELDDVELAILALGGSTTECLYVDDAKTWPRLLEQKLAQRLGRRVYVGNAGRAGHRTFQHTFLLRHYAPAASFDWVVVLCGFNEANWLYIKAHRPPREVVLDVTLLGYRPDAAPYKELAAYQIAERLLAGPPNPGFGTVQDAQGEWVLRRRAQRQRMLAHRVLAGDPPDLDGAMQEYRDDLRALIAAVRARGQKLLLLTQPYLPRAGLAPELRALLYTGVVPGEGAYPVATMARVLARCNEVLREVAAAERVPCLDVAAELPADTSVFYDDCHFNVAGCARLAELVARGFADLLTQ